MSDSLALSVERAPNKLPTAVAIEGKRRPRRAPQPVVARPTQHPWGLIQRGRDRGDGGCALDLARLVPRSDVCHRVCPVLTPSYCTTKAHAAIMNICICTYQVYIVLYREGGREGVHMAHLNISQPQCLAPVGSRVPFLVGVTLIVGHGVRRNRAWSLRNLQRRTAPPPLSEKGPSSLHLSRYPLTHPDVKSELSDCDEIEQALRDGAREWSARAPVVVEGVLEVERVRLADVICTWCSAKVRMLLELRLFFAKASARHNGSREALQRLQ